VLARSVFEEDFNAVSRVVASVLGYSVSGELLVVLDIQAVGTEDAQFSDVDLAGVGDGECECSVSVLAIVKNDARLSPRCGGRRSRRWERAQPRVKAQLRVLVAEVALSKMAKGIEAWLESQ
jgi:hypothetical protein